MKSREDREKAEYDALPEEVKLARMIDGFSNFWANEKHWSKMPLPLLREVVAWIKTTGMEYE